MRRQQAFALDPVLLLIEYRRMEIKRESERKIIAPACMLLRLQAFARAPMRE